MKTKHRQVNVTVNGQSVEVDSGIRGLILLVNRPPGIESYSSCQGRPGTRAYVQFGGFQSVDLLPDLASEIFRESLRKTKHGCHGSLDNSILLEVNGYGIYVRWYPIDYRRVLRIFKKLARRAEERKAKRRHLVQYCLLHGIDSNLFLMDECRPPRWLKVPISERNDRKWRAKTGAQ